jgi:AcrR family transcriptional regulator
MKTEQPEKFHHGNLRAALIEEGERMLEETGRAELSLRDLARKAGVTPMAAYRHFADKSALLEAIADKGFRALADLSENAKAEDPRAQLMELGRLYLSFAKARPAMHRLMFAEPLNLARVAEMSDASAAAYRPLYEAVRRALGPEAEELAVIDALVRVWSALHGYAALSLANRLPRAATEQDRFEAVFGPVIAAL